MNKLFKSIIVTFFTVFILTSLVQVNALACDDKCQKQVKKAVKRYTKAIVKMEEKSCNKDYKNISINTVIKKCDRALKSLDKSYDKYKDEVKNAEEIIALHLRHEKLHEASKIFAEIKKTNGIIHPFKNLVSIMEVDCSKARADYSESCQKLAKEGIEEYNSFSNEIKEKESLIAIKKDYDKCVVMGKESRAKYLVQKGQDDANNLAMNEYTKKYRELQKGFSALSMGKQNKVNNSFYLLKHLNSQLPEINKFSENCKGKYADLLKDRYKKDEVKNRCELATNAKQYHKQFTQAIIKEYMEDRLYIYNDAIAKLKERHTVYASTAKDMSFGWKEARKEIEDKIRNASKPAGLSMPSFDKLDKIPEKFEDAAESIAKLDSWDKVKYSMPNDAFEDMVEKIMAKKGEKLLKSGLSNKVWKVIKNNLGIPLRKVGIGYILTRHPEDDGFERMYFVRFNRDFTGTEYQKASSIEIKSIFTPFDD